MTKIKAEFSEPHGGITEGKLYELIDEDCDSYLIIDNDNEKHWYNADYFEFQDNGYLMEYKE